MSHPIRQIAILLLLVGSVSTGLGADYGPRKRVLIIESFGQPLATAGAVALKTTLEREFGQPIDIYHAALDVARFPGVDQEAQITEFLKARYQQRKVDLVVSMGAPAAHFVSRQRAQLFADTPILVTGMERRRLPPELARSSTTYVAAEVELPGHIENILRLLPYTRRIVMIHGSSSYDEFWAKENRRELERFAGRVEIAWLEGLSFEDIRAKVASLPQGSVVFLGLFVLDAAGIQIGRLEGVERLREVSKVPLFGYFESHLGKGIVGGPLYADLTTAVSAGRVAIRILNGEAPAAIAPAVVKQTAPIYDWRELRRFDISGDRLPPGSEVLYRQPSLWEAYRWHVATALTLLILQGVLISGLILQRARQRRAEAERRRVEAELQHTRVQLAHTTRVSALGELSGSLAHELNQPLTAILSNVQAAQRFMSAGSREDLREVREILVDIAADDKRASEIIRRMRSMVMKDDFDASPLDLASAVNEVVTLLHNDAVLRDVDVSLEVEPGLPAVLGDRIQLQQVVLNLLLNAFDAMKESRGADRAVRLCVGRTDEHMLKVTVADLGHGLPHEAIERVFEAFYTTKANGLGMGLSISRSIVEAHRGRLWAENNPTRGATFCFTVPLAAG